MCFAAKYTTNTTNILALGGYTCGNYVCDTTTGVKPPQWGVSDEGGVSPSRALGGVTPNPAHQTATITLNPNYTHLINQGVALEIFNTQGQLVKILLPPSKPSGDRRG